LAGISAYSVTHDPNDHRSDQTYNLNGAVTGANSHTFDYDAEDRLIGMDSGAVSVVYDGDGNLVQKTVGPEAYTYLIDTNSITGYAQILEIKRDGTLIDMFTYGANGIICQRNIPTAKVRYFSKDGSNSTRYLTDETGAITDTFDYSVDGILLDRTGTFPAVHLFQGEYYDSDLNLYWLRARWMNPQSGSFMGMDTYEGDFEEPLSLHKYGFVHWDGGVNLSDPSGNFGMSVAVIGGSLAVMGIVYSTITVKRDIHEKKGVNPWKIFNDPIVNRAMRQAYVLSNVGIKGWEVEQGGTIGMNSNRTFFVSTWGHGKQSSIIPDYYPTGMIGNAEVVGSFHTHPNIGKGWQQEPSPSDLNWFKNNEKSAGDVHFVITEIRVYLIQRSEVFSRVVWSEFASSLGNVR
jgi:RHS repeat-associated protein